MLASMESSKLERAPQESDKFIVRLPDGMRDTLKARAADNNRSMNAEIVAILGAAIEGGSGPMSAIDMEEVRRIAESAVITAVERAKLAGSVSYLDVEELAALVDCKPSQRSKMIAWLTENRWKFEVSSSGVPRVARVYHDRKMGIIDGPANSKFADEPNLEAFANRPRGRARKDE